MIFSEPFCWTRFGTEAGEPISDIFQRKNEERAVSSGIFLWGIGSAIGPSMELLVNSVSNPEVVFSAMLSQPRKVDTNPSELWAWRGGVTMDGQHYRLPDEAFVTSRKSSRAHYALVCYSASELRADPEGEEFSVESLRNLSSGNKIGASQVTAVVKPVLSAPQQGQKLYRVAMRASLVPPYFIRLIDPVDVPVDWHKDEFPRTTAQLRGINQGPELPLFSYQSAQT